MAKRSLRLLIADDEVFIREGLQEALQQIARFVAVFGRIDGETRLL